MKSKVESNNENGVGLRLKAMVISLTVLTCLAGIVFFILFFKRVYSNLGEPPWGKQLLSVAKKLEKDGLTKQAITFYKSFLDQSKPNMKIRAEISNTIAHLYLRQNDCASAIAWFYIVEEAVSQNSKKTTNIILLCSSFNGTTFRLYN